LNGQSNRRKREVQEGVDIPDIDPLTRNVHGNVRLVLMIGVNDFDGLPEYLAAEIRGCHLGDFVGALYLAERLVPKHAGIVYRHLIIALLIITGIIAAIF
jgi:hypothetical protein